MGFLIRITVPGMEFLQWKSLHSFKEEVRYLSNNHGFIVPVDFSYLAGQYWSMQGIKLAKITDSFLS